MTELTRKQRLRRALDGHDPEHGRTLAFALYAAIIASAVVLTVDSEPGLPGWAHRALGVAEIGIVLIFTAEYLARLWSAHSRLGYIFSFWGLIDLIAILPALLFLYPEMQALRTLRLFRALRLLKLLRLSRAAERLEYAIEQSREELALFTLLAAIALFLAAVGIYHFERVAQPEAFGSIARSLWWALATLTTVGYGDVYPVTTGGRVFTALTLLIGLGIVAIPAAVITSALLTAPDRDDDPHAKENDDRGPHS